MFDSIVGAIFSTAELLWEYQHLGRISGRFGIKLNEHESSGIAAMQPTWFSDAAQELSFRMTSNAMAPLSKYFGKKLIG